MSGWQTWRWPLTFAMLTVLGLLSALLGEAGAWWVLSWAALSVPLLAIAVSLVRSGRRASGSCRQRRGV
jgi:hypothetical protein